MSKSTVAGIENVTRELSLHPVHLKPDSDGNLPPSALVPFCSYQEERNILGEERYELQNLTLCDKFEPNILEAQLCYSLNVAKLARKPTKTGKKNGLFLLLDPNPFPMKSNLVKADRNSNEMFKVYIQTLAGHTAFGPGAYSMNTLKRMTGKPSFYQLPNCQKECQVHSREKCQTEMFLSQVKSNCSCVPWSLTTTNSNIKVISACVYSVD